MKVLVLKIILISFLIHWSVSLLAQDIVINEVMAKNETVIQDEDGDYSDWIEIYNKGDQIINLEGFYITDDSLNLNKWEFPEFELHPDSFLLIFASGKDKVTGSYFHTNFKVSSDGEPIIISDSLLNIIDKLPPIELSIDISFGRKPDGAEQLKKFELATPGTSNNFSNTLIFSQNRGYFTAPFKLYINSEDSEDVVYYSTDGSLPGPGSNIFTDSILIAYTYSQPNVLTEIPTTPDAEITDLYPWQAPLGLMDKSNVIRACSYHDTTPTSIIYTHSYFVDTLVYSRFQYPVISLVTDPNNFFGADSGIYVPGSLWDAEDPLWSGNYYQKTDVWERDVHLEYFEQSGEVGFFQNAGVRIHGKQSRRYIQKSLRLYARKKYGESKFNYPLLPQRDLDEYKHFILRNPYGDLSQTMIKDDMVHNFVRPLGLDIMESKPVVVFLNGEYWGMHTIRDHMDENYLEEIYDISDTSINLLENKYTLVHGTADGYIALYDFVANNDLSIPEHYNYIDTMIDINNFIDYQITEIFIKNYDWPGSNIKFWQSSEMDNKWRWMFFDTDFSFSNPPYNMLEHATLVGGTAWPNPDWSTLWLRKLLENENFKSQFIERFAELLNTHFQTHLIEQSIETFTSMYEPGMDRHIDRYGYPSSKTAWLYKIDFYLNSFAEDRPCFMRNHMMDFFELEEFDFSCDTTAYDEICVTNFNVYPNPGNGDFSVIIDFPEEFQMNVYDLYGKRVYSIQIPNPDIGQILNLDLSGSSTGIYFLEIIGTKETCVKRIVIAK